MKNVFALAIFCFATFACSNKKTTKDEKFTVTDTQQKKENLFNEVADLPSIKDTTKFTNNLRQIFNLDVHESPVQKKEEEITTFQKVKLYGSDKEFVFIEYDWKVGSNNMFSWKYQLLLTPEGKPVKALSGLRFEFVEIFQNENPFLLIVAATAKGNGGHEIYKISADTLKNVYEGYYDYDVRTYDAHEDLAVFKPNELKISFKDENKDDFNDMLFTGEKLMLGKYTKDSFWYDVDNGKPFTPKNPSERIPIKFIFLYDKQSGHFKAKENY